MIADRRQAVRLSNPSTFNLSVIMLKQSAIGGILALFLVRAPLSAQQHALPFTQAENADGARFVWFALGRAGFSYPYIPADSFPTSSEFTQVDTDSAQAGDLAWWPHFVAIYSGAPDSLLVLVGERVKISEVVARRGTPRFYRKLVPR